jgi:hypothetical protein
MVARRADLLQTKARETGSSCPNQRLLLDQIPDNATFEDIQ